MADRSTNQDKQNRDYREYLRKNCYLPIIEPERNTKPFGNVLNLSTSGLFLVTKGVKDQTERLKAKFIVPGTSKPINFLGEVVYVKNEERNPFRGIGVRFVDIDSTHQKALKSYILNHNFNETLKGYQKRRNSSLQNLKPFSDEEIIYSLLAAAAQKKAPIQIFWCRGNYTLITAGLRDIGKYHLSLMIPEQSKRAKINTYDHLYLGMTYECTSYFFEATVKYVGNDLLTITRPEVIYFEERRVESRHAVGSNGNGGRAVVEFWMREKGGHRTVQQIVDINSSGLSFIFPLGDNFFSPGRIIQEINIIKDQEIQRQDIAKVVHVTPIGRNQLKVGLEFGIERQPYDFRRIEFHKNQEQPSLISSIVKKARRLFGATGSVLGRFLGLHGHVHVVKFYNKSGREIVGILNHSFNPNRFRKKVTAPVIIIPPAYGRRKEATSLLAETLVETFKKNKQNVIVIRYDGIRAVGESYIDPENKEPGKEMLSFTISQAVDDLRTTLDYCCHNDSFSAEKCVIISFSNASVVARRAIIGNRKVNCWINIMGTTDPQDLIYNATGGIDYISNFIAGDKFGVVELLGHRVKKAAIGDLLETNTAYLEDARNDMSKISIPITWIYGKYDFWTNQKRVVDIMSVKSSGVREIIEVPTGHVVKTTTEAFEVFKLVTRCVWKRLFGEDVSPVTPNSNRAARITEAEWSRIKHPPLDSRGYWKTYLLGRDRGDVGFDIMALTDEYIELMEKQVELLQIGANDIIGDMGGGTGNFAKILIQNGVPEIINEKAGHTVNGGPKIITVDIVPEAMIRARQKHESLLKSKDINDLKMYYLSTNLDLSNGNLLLPFKDGLFTKILGSLLISYLSDPVKVLKEFYRLLKPGGQLILSSMKPDLDMSKPLTSLIAKLNSSDFVLPSGVTKEDLLTATRSYINQAASLINLEEERLFRFYSGEELSDLMKSSKFRDMKIHDTFGTPPQAVIVSGLK
jgi:ubiquinone/menaquinone biosynthesis C-methylase UbiE